MSVRNPFEFVENASREFPDVIAIDSEQAKITFAELKDNSLRIAQVLRENGIKPGDVVGTRLPTALDAMVRFALFHEATIGSSIPGDAPETVFEKFDWLVCLTEEKHFPREKQILLNQAFLNRVAITPPAIGIEHYPDEETTCMVSFSSGTTGEPKLIEWDIACVYDRVVTRREQWMPVSPYLCLLGLSTALGIITLLANVNRRETYFDVVGAQNQLLVIAENNIQCVMGSPIQLNFLLKQAQRDISQEVEIPLIMSAGSHMPDSLILQLEKIFKSEVRATYASSEGGSVSVRVGTEGSNSTKSRGTYAGKLLPGAVVKILDENGMECIEGEVGDIAVGRPHQPRKYLLDPENSAMYFRNGFFYPGDRGFMKGEELYLVGRSTEIINAGGVKINPAVIEAVSIEFEGIDDVAAFPILRKDNGLQSLALAFTSHGKVDPQELAKFLIQRLGVRAPTALIQVPHIERNHMGKVNRQELSEKLSVSLD